MKKIIAVAAIALLAAVFAGNELISKGDLKTSSGASLTAGSRPTMVAENGWPSKYVTGLNGSRWSVIMPSHSVGPKSGGPVMVAGGGDEPTVPA